MLKRVVKIDLFTLRFFVTMVLAVYCTLATAQVEELDQDAAGQEQSAQDQQTAENADSLEPKDDQQIPKASKPSARDEVFIPSEELSEDTSAPFPVDI